MPSLNNTRKPQYTADLWQFTSRTDTEGGVIRTHYFARSIKLDVTQDRYGAYQATLSNAEADIEQYDQLRSLKAKDGTELYPGGIWTMTTFSPIITPFGFREGFNGQLELQYRES